MKTIFLIILLTFLLIISCKSTNSIYNKQMKEAYIHSFKLTYYENLMIKGFNNSEELKFLISSDRSGFSEILLSIEDYNLIDSLTTKDNQIMLNDSIDRIERVAEGSDGKRVLEFSINKYNSKWIDDLAKQRYKIKIISERQ